MPTFGKTGTTSDYRDAFFVGFAGDLVVGVWIGNDDNSPLPGTSGGGAPARIWRAFMAEALGARPAAAAPVPLSQADRGDANDHRPGKRRRAAACPPPTPRQSPSRWSPTAMPRRSPRRRASSRRRNNNLRSFLAAIPVNTPNRLFTTRA